MDAHAKRILAKALEHLEKAQAEIESAHHAIAAEPIHNDSTVSEMFLRTKQLKDQVDKLTHALTAVQKKS